MENHFLALFGWLLWIVGNFTFTKNQFDKREEHFNYKKFFDLNWDNWVFTLLLAPVLVLYLCDFVDLINLWFKSEIPVFGVYYLGCGPLSELIFIVGSKLKNKANG